MFIEAAFHGLETEDTGSHRVQKREGDQMLSQKPETAHACCLEAGSLQSFVHCEHTNDKGCSFM